MRVFEYRLADEFGARFKRFNEAFCSPVTEVHLLFYQAILQCFAYLNKLLQREKPIVGVISTQINEFLKKLLGKFVTV